jgi:uncharacterized protein (DUF1800 family)
MHHSRIWKLGIAAALIAAPAVAAKPDDIAFLNRMSWGANAADAETIRTSGATRWFEDQLRMPADMPLPQPIAAQIAAMRISGETMPALVVEAEAEAAAAKAITDPDQRKAANQARQQKLGSLKREAQARSLLRDIYSPAQLREQMTWFWFNLFNVQSSKRDIEAMIGDYEDTIRAHALGRYRDLLEATLRHPAMLRYLDNDQNAANRINENYAREIMELHSMGVGSGYSQKDVQELARILTGVGISTRPDPPRLKPEWQPLYVRAGLFTFNPARHDFGAKTFLGHEIKGSGYGEVSEALDLIATSPATAHHIAEKLATFFVGDTPPPALVDRMAATFRKSGGDTGAVLRTMVRAPEFRASLGGSFKDPVHYVVSALRLTYSDRAIVNADPALNWLNRMGEGLFAHETPDGYALGSAAWTGPGQMNVRFEIARQIGSGAPALFRPKDSTDPPAPLLSLAENPLYAGYYAGRVAPATRAALDQAHRPADWNALFLSSPEFMHR